jgi:hypothetical protein
MTTHTSQPLNGEPPEPPDDIDDADEVDAAPPDPSSIRGMLQDPGVRNYLIAGLAALAMVFTILFGQGSDIGGVLLVLIGAAGLVLRWPAAPPFFLILLVWFLIYPLGIPDPDTMPLNITDPPFQIEDLLLIVSVVVYLASHYRVYGLSVQAMPFERRVVRKADEPTRRPSGLIQDGELARLLYLTVGVVVAGQLLWLFVSRVEIDVLAGFPLRWSRWRRGYPGASGDIPPGTTRFLLVTGLLLFGTLLARLVFGYWRLRAMSAAEGGMILQDTGWDETRRERTRIEAWRGWRKGRAEQNESTAGGKKP